MNFGTYYSLFNSCCIIECCTGIWKLFLQRARRFSYWFHTNHGIPVKINGIWTHRSSQGFATGCKAMRQRTFWVSFIVRFWLTLQKDKKARAREHANVVEDRLPRLGYQRNSCWIARFWNGKMITHTTASGSIIRRVRVSESCVQGAALKKPPGAKCIIVAVVLNFPAKFSGTVP